MKYKSRNSDYEEYESTSKMILSNFAQSTQPPTKELCRKQNKTHFLQNETQKPENRRKKSKSRKEFGT